jgi:hypothetical protein
MFGLIVAVEAGFLFLIFGFVVAVEADFVCQEFSSVVTKCGTGFVVLVIFI